MLNFNDLNIQEASKSIGRTNAEVSKLVTPKIVSSNIQDMEVLKKKIDFRTDILKKAPKRSRAEAHLIEPGNKVPISDYGSVVQWCDECDAIRSFADKNTAGKMICLTCKTIRKYKTLK